MYLLVVVELDLLNLKISTVASVPSKRALSKQPPIHQKQGLQ